MRPRVGVLLALVLALTGCAGLANDEAVRDGLPIEASDAPVIDYVPPAPNAGADPSSIILGFVRAGAASDGTYEVARRYLTADAAKAWSPDRAVVVLTGAAPLKAQQLAAGTWRLSGAMSAVVDSDGRSTPAVPNSTATADLRLTKVDGEWRIASVPAAMGRWITASDFSRLFAAESVHFLARGRGSLIPDERWFPRDHLATRVAAAQLEPVPTYLQAVAATEVPNGAKLGNPGVTLLDGTAIVDIAAPDLTSDTDSRRQLWAQFATTLTQLSDVSKVVIQYEGATVDFSGRPEGGLAPEDLGLGVTPMNLTTYPVVRSGTQVVQYVGQRVQDIIGGRAQGVDRRTYPPIDTIYDKLALSNDGSEIAGVREDGLRISRWRGEIQYDVPVTATQIGRPTYDALGYLWFGGVGSSGGKPTRLWWVDKSADPADPTTSRARRVEASWLDGRVVVTAKLSPEGDRIAVASTNASGGDPRVDLAGVVRDRAGAPQSLATSVRLGSTLRRVVDLTWLDPVTLGVLGGLRGESRPFVLSLNGTLRALDESPDLVAMTTLGGERDAIVVSSKGEARIRAGSNWLRIASGSDFAVAGG
jgi:hypothetical protein